MSKLNVMVIGCGRIGQMHVRNLLHHFSDTIDVAAIVDDAIDADWLSQYQLAQVLQRDMESAIARYSIDAFMIATASVHHVGLIKRCLAFRKPIFCEKPVSFDVEQLLSLHEQADDLAVPIQVGLNRRFDPDFASLRQRYMSGEIGEAQLIQITNRDPMRPEIEFVRDSGGLFLDFNVHDFDMLRFLTGDEIESVHAFGGALIEPALASFGDIDTALINLRLRSGALAVIDCSRETHYGYDQRCELHAQYGDLAVVNHKRDSITRLHAEGGKTAAIDYSFVERYRESYRLQIQAFIDAVDAQAPVQVGLLDVAAAVHVAKAAQQSLSTAAAQAVTPLSDLALSSQC